MARQHSSTFGGPTAVFASAAVQVLGASTPPRQPPSDLERWSRRRTLAFVVTTNACAWALIAVGVREALRAL